MKSTVAGLSITRPPIARWIPEPRTWHAPGRPALAHLRIAALIPVTVVSAATVMTVAAAAELAFFHHCVA